ncbi:ORF6N domain-containing protein [Clostridiaceae bacterium]|nr:ORF6N domain-containing protein [Clostridiaceae bacterium]
MSGKVVKVNNQNVAIKDFNGQRVVTFKDIDTVHERADGTARKRFNDNKKHFVEGEDYFVRKTDEAQREYGIAAPNGLTLITESGYLMLVKSFTDDLAWNVQRQLVKSYFKAVQQNEAKRKVQSGRLSLSSVNMMVKNVMGTLERAKVEPVYIAAEVKRLYTELGYEVKIPLVTEEYMPKLYDCTEIARELGILSSSGKPHNQAVSAIIAQLNIADSEIVTTAFSRNGHDDMTLQYKPSVIEEVRKWLADSNYPTKIPYVDSKGNQKTYTVVYREVA